MPYLTAVDLHLRFLATLGMTEGALGMTEGL